MLALATSGASRRSRVLQLAQFQVAPLVHHRARAQRLAQQVEVQRQVLDQAAAERQVVVADPTRELGVVAAGQGEHVTVAVDADNPPLGPHHLRGDVADLAATAPQVEHRLSRPEVSRRVAAAVVALQDLDGDRFEIPRVVLHRTAQRRLHPLRPGAISLANGVFDRFHGRFISLTRRDVRTATRRQRKVTPHTDGTVGLRNLARHPIAHVTGPPAREQSTGHPRCKGRARMDHKGTSRNQGPPRANSQRDEVGPAPGDSAVVRGSG